MRYRPASIVPGRKRPAPLGGPSALGVGAAGGGAGLVLVSSGVRPSAAPQRPQNRWDAGWDSPQAGHVGTGGVYRGGVGWLSDSGRADRDEILRRERFNQKDEG
jgi:hypothetical protein